jgi:transcriptional regulator with PAS, ATPase and Fis domain
MMPTNYKEKELRQEQQAIWNLHNELTNVFDSMSDGVLVLDQEARVSQLNPAAIQIVGYSEGAFTGAKRGGRLGKFELASKGTLMLDEIGDMPLEQQAILLRAIQEKAIMRVGGDTLIHVDVRIIAATNQNLLKLVEQGRFRADLYYRLNVVQISIPPLRERSEDIELLFKYFIETMSPKFNRHITEIQPAVIKCLQTYEWPGNIRELQNVVERILLVSEDGLISIEHLPREIVNAAIGHKTDSWENKSNFLPSGSPALTDRRTRKLAFCSACQPNKGLTVSRIYAAVDKEIVVICPIPERFSVCYIYSYAATLPVIVMPRWQ